LLVINYNYDFNTAWLDKGYLLL